MNRNFVLKRPFKVDNNDDHVTFNSGLSKEDSTFYGFLFLLRTFDSVFGRTYTYKALREYSASVVGMEYIVI